MCLHNSEQRIVRRISRDHTSRSRRKSKHSGERAKGWKPVSPKCEMGNACDGIFGCSRLLTTWFRYEINCDILDPYTLQWAIMKCFRCRRNFGRITISTASGAVFRSRYSDLLCRQNILHVGRRFYVKLFLLSMCATPWPFSQCVLAV